MVLVTRLLVGNMSTSSTSYGCIYLPLLENNHHHSFWLAFLEVATYYLPTLSGSLLQRNSNTFKASFSPSSYKGHCTAHSQ